MFAWPAADGAIALTYDRSGRRHALTLFDGRELGDEIILQGRRFSVTPGVAREWRL